MSFDSKDPARRLAKQLNCPACSGAGEEYFANGYVCKICGRRESMFLKAITADAIRADLRLEVSRLRKIESAAVAAVEYEQWTGGTFYDLMIDLQKALRG